MLRAQFMWATAQPGAARDPARLRVLTASRAVGRDAERNLVAELDRPFGCYEFDADGKPHWRQATVRRLHPAQSHGVADLRRRQPDRQTRSNVSGHGRPLSAESIRCASCATRYRALRLNSLAVGTDNRNRTLLSPYGSQDRPESAVQRQIYFRPGEVDPLPDLAATRSRPDPPRLLAARSRIAAILSGDGRCSKPAEGDIYIGIAKQLGFAPPGTRNRTKPVRTMFKSVVLGIMYGLAAKALATRIGVSLFEAAEILARLRAQFRVWEDYAHSVLDHAGFNLEIGTPSAGACSARPGSSRARCGIFRSKVDRREILHVACILAERRGIEIVAPVHDALMADAISTASKR